jgi:hypothetical protein
MDWLPLAYAQDIGAFLKDECMPNPSVLFESSGRGRTLLVIACEIGQSTSNP